MVPIAWACVRLRWWLLRGAVRHGGAEQVGAVISTVASVIVGFGAGGGILVAGRTADHPGDLAVILCATVTVAILGFGVVAGVAQPIDPRVIAAEPLTDRVRAVGLLAGSVFGPPGLAGIMLGIGLAGGMVRGVSTLPVIALAVTSWLISMLLIARTATTLLALLTSRFPRAGQIIVGLCGLLFYGLFQFVPALLGRMNADERTEVADWMAWTPSGQIGRSLATADESVGRSLLHLAVGSIWLPLLAVGFGWSTKRLASATRQSGGNDTADAAAGRLGRFVRRACGSGPTGAIAWRTLLTRFRTPRTVLETFTGAGVGLAAVLVPTIVRDSPGSGAVLVGGAVQLSVLFMSGNSFGVDGPALTHELLAGTDGRTLVRGKARSIALVAAPLAVIGPVAAAAITGEWRYLVAGFGVGVGGLLAGTGAAVVQSALVPIAIPESDNPFASGESGKGIIAALLLFVVLAALAVATIPIALLLFWATDRGNTALVTVFGALTVVAGWIVGKLGVQVATRRLTGRDPEFILAVTPTR